MNHQATCHQPDQDSLTRRRFLAGTLGAAVPLAASSSTAQEAVLTQAPAPSRRIRTGFVGLGGRGLWIAKLFLEHGGYEASAVADYFPEVAAAGGRELGVDAARCFSGLSGFRKVIDSGIEAIVLEVPPFFLPEMCEAAVEAGLHVFMAKPVASDVPGALRVEAAAALATRKNRCFLVDYQAPTEPHHIEIVSRIREGAIGSIAHVESRGICEGFGDPKVSLEESLKDLIWVNHVALGCDYIGNFDIHAVDLAVWVLGERPVAAIGTSAIRRADPHGDSRDVCDVLFEYASGVPHRHIGMGLRNRSASDLSCAVSGTAGNGRIAYFGKTFLHGGSRPYAGGEVTNLYKTGAQRNITTFHHDIVTERSENLTVRRAIDGCLACILGREAAARKTRLTMEQLLAENTALTLDLSWLKA